MEICKSFSYHRSCQQRRAATELLSGPDTGGKGLYPVGIQSLVNRCFKLRSALGINTYGRTEHSSFTQCYLLTLVHVNVVYLGFLFCLFSFFVVFVFVFNVTVSNVCYM